MVCGRCMSSIIVRAGIFRKRVILNCVGKGFGTVPLIGCFSNRVFRKYIGMMVDTGSMSRAGTVVDMVTQKDDDGARGGFVSGGWKRSILFSQFAHAIYLRITVFDWI